MDDREARRWLLRRIHIEAAAYANADGQTKQMRLGRLRAYLEVGAAFGYWTERSANQAAEMIEIRQSLRRLSRVLRAPHL